MNINKLSIRSGIIFGIMMIVFFAIYHFFELEVYTLKSVLKSFISAAIGGSVAGLFYGFSYKFINKSAVKIEISDLGVDERIVFKTIANNTKRANKGGVLFLTNKRLYFSPYHVNEKNKIIKLSIDDIVSVEKQKSLGVIPNRLLVNTKAGSKDIYIVEKLNYWISEIEKIKRIK